MHDTIAPKYTASRDASGWSATSYRNIASYVYSSRATALILQLLDARPGERILDFGCGSGEVTAEIARLVGPQGMVVGVDTSESMIAKARETTKLPDTLLIKCDIQAPQLLEELPPDFVGRCDKIFSNAVLHWCSRDPLGVLANVRRVLKAGGLFVAEMGGHGNVADVRNALHDALLKRGIDPVARDPWFFPTPDQYTQLLKSANLHPLSVTLHPRETPIADLAGWIRLFCGHNFLEGIEPEDEQEIICEVVATCRKADRCRWDEQKKLWYLDYVRLRVTATKVGD
ncbi:S-adenosyl-L-methionine-dependent methyltransferase [Lactarius indigo]|nr:S-adenosyl-L-methionine-dependent methyltransferase [Lactarius indigo]